MKLFQGNGIIGSLKYSKKALDLVENTAKGSWKYAIFPTLVTGYILSEIVVTNLALPLIDLSLQSTAQLVSGDRGRHTVQTSTRLVGTALKVSAKTTASVASTAWNTAKWISVRPKTAGALYGAANFAVRSDEEEKKQLKN